MKFEDLIKQLNITHDTFYGAAVKSVNIALTIRNWLFGFHIVEYEQNGEDRAKYGSELLKKLAKSIDLKGISETNLKVFRQFYQTYPHIGQALPDVFNVYPIRQALPDKLLSADIKHISLPVRAKEPSAGMGLAPVRFLQLLSFTHIVELIKIVDPIKRAFYEIECAKGTWSTRELQRQIESLYFERSGLSRDKKKLSEHVNQKAVRLSPGDLINDPITVEFLGLSDRALVTETDLEQAILDHLQMFLLELGHGFCFEARQKRILIDDEYYFIDLVFYHRILKCHILVDLKTEKFKHSHVGQMNTYLEYFKNEVMQEGDNPPVGILLCTDKGNTLVKYATAGLEKSVFVHKYLVELPSKEELEKYLLSEIQ